MCALTEGSLRISVAAKDGELKFLNRRLGGLGGVKYTPPLEIPLISRGWLLTTPLPHLLSGEEGVARSATPESMTSVWLRASL